MMFYISAAIARDRPIDGHPVEGDTVHREVFLEPTMFDIEDIWDVGVQGRGGGIPAPVYYTPNAHTPTTAKQMREM